jgi:predicted site-specific integrase-resolvase
MTVIHMNQRQLANRWGVSEATLERWRSEGIGPRYLKLQGRVMYREKDIEAYESRCLRQSTSQPVKERISS